MALSSVPADDAKLSSVKLPDLVRAAWETGRNIDLAGIGYGRAHWGGGKHIHSEPGTYYYFLAGLSRLTQAQRVLEIGTHWGGSARAMWSGLPNKDDSLIVTVDITSESDAQLADYPRIKKIVGDANRPEVLREVLAQLGDAPLDILYVDADHTFMPTFLNYCLYAAAFRPKIAVFDDVTLNQSMREAWLFISRSVPQGDAIDAAEIVPEIRPQKGNPGFGVVMLRHNF